MNNLRCIIISQPKAGTYLCANLLQEMGLCFDGYHISKNKYEKYNLADLAGSRFDLKKYTHKSDLKKSLSLIKNNCIGVSHLQCTSINKDLLKNFKIILLLRDYKDCLDSWEKWSKYRYGKKLSYISFDSFQNISKWENEDNVFTIRFESMVNKHISKIDELQLFLFNQIIYDSSLCIDKALSKDSLTKMRLRK